MTEPTEPTPESAPESAPDPTGSPPVIEVTIKAPPERVWQALRDPALLERWHGWHYDDGDGLDGEIRIIYHDGATEDAAAFVLELSDHDRFSLHPSEHGTVVRVTRAPRSDEGEWAAYYDDITEGWQTFLEQLRFAVERHDLAPRRTVMLEGTLRSGGTLVDAFGLSGVAALPPGAPYQAVAATGDPLTGQVWARRPHQLVLTVDGAGDGLLVLAEMPPSAHRPDGGGLVVLTWYGDDRAGFDALRTRWTRWWQGVRRPAEAAP